MAKKLIIQYDLKPVKIDKAFRPIETQSARIGKLSGKKFKKEFKQETNGLGNKLLGGLKSQLKSFGALAAAAGGAFLLKESIRSAADFEKALIEINTILPKNTKLTDRQTSALKNLAKQYGTSATDQAKSYYQVISAGITDAALATDALDAANKLAVGGLSDVGSSIDILTSIINVYGAENITAEEAADSLFKTVQLGKTTISELSSSLGLVLPSAKAAGVGLNEANSAIALLTANGRSTARAVTEVNAVINGFARNGAKLGKGLNTAAIKADGLGVVVARLIQYSKDSGKELVELLGSTEAVSGALTLGANNGKTFNGVLTELSKNAGASGKAFDQVAKSADFQFKKLSAELDVLGIEIGTKLLPIVLKLAEAFSFLLRGGNDPIKAMGVDRIRAEVSALQLQVDTLREGSILPDWLTADLDESEAKLAKYQKRLRELTITEGNLVEQRKNNANSQPDFLELFGSEGDFFGVNKGIDESVGKLKGAAAVSKGIKEEEASDNKKLLEQKRIDQQLFSQASLNNETTIINAALAKQEAIEALRERDLITREEYNEALLANEQTKEDKLSSLAQQRTDANVFSFNAIGKAFIENNKRMKASARDVASIVQRSFQTGFGNAFQAVGAALASGASAMDAFKSAVMGTFADLASSLGNYYIALGIARTAAYDPGGPATLAAGIGLKVLSGVLSASGGSSAGTPSTGGGGGGSVTGSAAAGFNQDEILDEPDSIDRREPETSVSITVNGDILDSEETGTKLASVLSDSFGKQGVVLRDARFA